MNLKERCEKVEILAPAGSYEIMTAVIKAGADAVYLGGDLFGARAFAGNFDEEELLKAIDYAHLHGRKIYLTVNTLLKDRELKASLIKYLTPFYEAGLDAVIVQDFGVLKMIREHFPDLDIHASTQMAITGHHGAQMLKDAGATRIVTARELSQQEIKSIHDTCDIEIESFVHGALCYCYSGQCLFSSMNGGRSGNRGRCAQPCRMNYKVSDENGRVNQTKQEYVLSPKDMCALPILPDVIDAGVYSLKIEGRMKNVTYAAGVTAIYRKYVDMYLTKGRKGYRVSDQDMNDLMDLYNRGAFTSGYYQTAKGKEMISLNRPNHMGTKALKIQSNHNGLVTFEALEPIHAQDVFEIDKENSFSSGSEYRIGQTFQVNLPRRYRLNKGDILFRTRNNKIVLDVQENIVDERLREDVFGQVRAVVGEPLQFTLSDGNLSVTVSGEVVDQAVKQPVKKEKLQEQFSKLGDTDFQMKEIEIYLEGDSFIPVGQMNELRRQGVNELLTAIMSQYRRTVKNKDDAVLSNESSKAFKHVDQADPECLEGVSKAIRRTALVTSLLQADYLSDSSDIDTIYYDYGLFDRNEKGCEESIKKCHNNGKKAIAALPHMLRDKNDKRFYELIKKAARVGVDAYLVRNMEEIGALAAMKKSESSLGEINIITDAGLYVWNTKAADQLKSMITSHGMNLLSVTLAYEETAREMADMNQKWNETESGLSRELVVYTRMPLMISEQCVRKTFGKCDGKNGSIVITDRKDKDYLVKSYCSYCYTVIYDQKDLNLNMYQEQIIDTGVDSIRYEFVDETQAKQSIASVLAGQELAGSDDGHFLLGVE